MQTANEIKNVRQLRFWLKQWGQFWARQEQLPGFAKKSNVEKIKEVCELGGFSSSSLHLHNNGSAFIKVPDNLVWLDSAIAKLNTTERTVLVARYVKLFERERIKAWCDLRETKSVDFWLLRAERALL